MDSERNKKVHRSLSRHRKNLENLSIFTRKQELKYKAGLISFEIETLENCQQYLRKLKKVVDKSGLESFFGVHVLLHELDRLFKKAISKIKTATNNYSTDMPAENVNKLLKKLEKHLLKSSFLKFNDSSASSENVIFLGKPYDRKDSLDELVKYYSVGTALKDDSETENLLEELRNLRNDYFEISPYSAIIGPSYMGKTQTAFTLANVINIIYVNFVPAKSDNPQRIYSLFIQIARLFRSTTLHDAKDSRFDDKETRARDILESDWPFQTLGLIYAIIRTRKLTGLDGLVWLKELVNIGTAMIPPMTRADFISKTSDIELENQLLFIDELPRNSRDLVLSIKFLRNLCRAIRLPVAISGTNSRVRNMIALTDATESRTGEPESYPWVQVTVKTPRSSLMTFCHLIKFQPHSGNAMRCLKEFVNLEANTLDYEQLFRSLYGDIVWNQAAPVKKLIEFFLKQSETCLPGISPLIFTKLFAILPTITFENVATLIDDLKTLWKNLVMAIITEVKNRKLSLTRFYGLLGSAHILTFPSPEKTSLETGHFSAKLVEQHLFRYSSMGDTSFRLDVNMVAEDSDDEPGFIRDGTEYEDKCYFPELNEDFVTTFISLGIWNLCVTEFERRTGTRKCTLGTIYEKYLRKITNYRVQVIPKTVDSFTLELLAHWSICYASHSSFNGETGGIELFSEFVKNLQNLKNMTTKSFVPCTLSGLKTLPEGLADILNRIKVPFLMRFSQNESLRIRIANELTNYLGDFIQIGRSYLPETSIGWDVLFDLKFDEQLCTGFIECKLWEKAVGIASFFKYYLKSCRDAHPLSFMVCRKLQNYITSLNAASNLEHNLNKKSKFDVPVPDYILEDEEEEEEYESDSEEVEEKVKKVEKPKIDYFKLLRELWADQSCRINIYTVKFINSPSSRTGVFTAKALKKFTNPTGAFILVESSFNPPLRSSRSN